MKLSDYVWQFIADLGIRHVFMFPGGGAMHLVDSLGNNEKIENVTMLHEQACAMAAETYSRITYNYGALLVTTGPGGTNAVTGVAAAWLESSPVIVISGQAKTEDLKDGYGVRQRGNQEIGIVDIVSTITKYAVTVKNPLEIKYHLERAAYEARNGRPGPVWIDIPLDVQAADIDPDKLEDFFPQKHDGSTEVQRYAESTIALLKTARRPVIIAGQGIERGNGKAIFRKMVDLLKAPVIFSWMATELLEYDHPYNFGKPGIVAPRYSNFAMQDSDLIISIGSRLDPAMIGYDPADFAPDAKKVVIDIDSTEISKFAFNIAVKAVTDATEFIEELYRQLLLCEIPSYADWTDKCRKWKNKYPLVKEEFRQEKGSVNPYHFFDKLSDYVDDDGYIIPGSSGACIDVYWLCFKNRRYQRTLSTGALGSMGYGIPAAIGACLAGNRRKTVCVEGDGSIQLNIQELAVINGMKLPIKIFINGNKGYLSIMNMQRNHFNSHLVGADSDSGLYIADLNAVAKAYGINTFKIDDHNGMEQIIKEVIASDGPALCYVNMRNDLVIQPKVVSRVSADGNMISGTLRNLWPYVVENDEAD